ncbi:MAG: hypothetical protein GTO13_19410 [Proteobacteria bacterium]|nr:hypothetical protein [Pseudomonadota bacterium]
MRVFKRKFKSGVKWGIDYTLAGKRKRVIVGDTRKEAQAFAEEVIQNKNRIKIGLPTENYGKPIPRTINEALEIFFDERLPSFRSPSIVKHFGKRVGVKGKIRQPLPRRCLKKRYGGVSRLFI